MKTNYSKHYTSPSNAKRAAKAAGIAADRIGIKSSVDGHQYYELPAKPDLTTKSVAKKVTEKKAPAKKVAKPGPVAFVEKLEKATDYKVSHGHDLTEEQKAELAKLKEQAIEKGDIVSAPTAFEKGTGDFPTMIIRKSVIKNPVQESWELFDVLRKDADKAGQKLRRKDAIAAAVEGGIAFYTARTQYQSWKTANKF